MNLLFVGVQSVKLDIQAVPQICETFVFDGDGILFDFPFRLVMGENRSVREEADVIDEKRTAAFGIA